MLKGGVAGLLMRQQSQQNIYYMTNHLGHVYGGGVAGLLMRQQSQQNIYYMTNHLGHVYGVFDQAGERLSQRGYSPYG
ncbi:hypothetical protein [Vibrio splendidus]|uniref:hypothetical protein n=1 Tax=Vibrio splendidus TaxID=29497 RepID=UPI0021597017|nr:hypothetical protein [Vibrio splendidus]